MPELKILTIRVLYIIMVLHVNMTSHLPFPIRCSQGFTLSVTVIPLIITRLTITRISSLAALLSNPIWELCTLRFLLVVYGSELLVCDLCL